LHSQKKRILKFYHPIVMAKQLQSIVRLSGRLGDVVYVNSDSYGDHVRLPRGSKKPATINPSLQRQAERTSLLNGQAKQVYLLLKPVGERFMEGMFWQAILKRFRQAGDPVAALLESLTGLELNSAYKLTRFVDLPKVDVQANKTRLHVSLTPHGKLVLPRPFNSFQYSLILLFFDKTGKAIGTEAVLFPANESLKIPESCITVKRPKGSVYWLCCVHGQAGVDGQFEATRKAQGMAVAGSGKL
jgi:hypothetical protein